MSFGIVITAYEEHRKPGYLEKALEIALDPRVDEVIVSDDCSSDWKDTANRIINFMNTHPIETKLCGAVWQGQQVYAGKIKPHTNDSNLGVFGNKLAGIRRASTDWVQSLDSDNCLNQAYLDTLFGMMTDPNRMLCPSFAKPEFDYRAQAGNVIEIKNFSYMLSWRRFGCLLNTGNQCFHRETFLDVFKEVPTERYDRWTHDYFAAISMDDLEHRKIYDSADSFCFNKHWLLAGKKLFVGPGLEYDHPVHEHSSWRAAPKLKEALPPIYFQELVDTSKGRQPKRYSFKNFCNSDLGRAVSMQYMDEYGRAKTRTVAITNGQETVASPPPKPKRRWR
jgi:glycosyltransferase involved in cell wall biosynthesis